MTDDDALAYAFHEGSDPVAPVLLLLHSTGGDPDELLPLVAHLSRRSPVLAPAGAVSENGTARWFRRLREGVFDHEDVVRRAEQLAGFVRDAVERHGLGGRRLVAVGFSNGANIAAALLLLHPDVLREAVLFAAMMPVPDPPDADLSRTRVFLSGSEGDPMAPAASAAELVAALDKRGAAVETYAHGSGHTITLDGVRAAAAWLG